MGIVRIIKGDLIKLAQEGAFQAIGHGANCHNIMGAGIAKSVKENLPQLFAADEKMHSHYAKPGEPAAQLAGHISTAKLEAWNGTKYHGINLYTQIDLGANAKYEYLHMALANMCHWLKGRSITKVGLPLIGAGIGGLDIMAVLTIINAATLGLDVYIVVFDKDEKSWEKAKEFKNYQHPVKFDAVVNSKIILTEDYVDFDKVVISDAITGDILATPDTGEAFVSSGMGDRMITFGETPVIYLVKTANTDMSTIRERLY